MPTAPTTGHSPAAPCIGRGRELDQLAAQWALARRGRAGFCRISGDAGSGKTTLLRAFAASLACEEPDAVVAFASCDQQTGDIRPLAPWTEILQSLAGEIGIEETPAQGKRRANVVHAVRSAVKELAPDILELLVPGVGLVVRSAKLIRRSPLAGRLSSDYTRPEAVAVAADRSQIQDQYLAVVEQVLDQAPLVLILDDLDCSDEASMQLLARLLDKTRERRVLFLAATRESRAGTAAATVLERIAAEPDVLTLDLDAAREQSGREFVAAYVEAVVPGLDDAFVQQLFHHTGGHPLFVAELVEHLRQRGDIAEHSAGWRAHPALSWGDMPRRIESILARQWRDLDDELADILQAGSAQGDQFSVEVISGVLEKSPIAVARALTRRAPKNLVAPVGNRALGEAQVTLFRFSHSLARSHIYTGIDPLESRYLHEAIAAQLESLAGDQLEPVAAQLAYQYEQAGNGAKAARFYQQAADGAIATCSLVEARTQLQRALKLCSSTLEQIQLQHRLAKLNMMMGELPLSVELFTEARQLAEREQAPGLVVLLADQALALVRVNDLEGAWAVAQRAEALARQEDNNFGLLSALQTLAHIHSKNGRQKQALACQTEAMALAGQLDDEDLMADCLNKQGWYFKELGRYEEAREVLERSLAIQQRGQPNFSQLAATHNALSDMYISLGDYTRARENLLRAIDSWQRFDRNTDVAVGLSNLANLANREGAFDEALEYGRQAYEMDVQVLGDDHPELAFSLSCIGESLLGLGRHEEAIDALGRAHDIRRRHTVPEGNLAWSAWLHGRALVESGSSVDEGHRHVASARAVLQGMGAAAGSELEEIDAWLAKHKR